MYVRCCAWLCQTYMLRIEQGFPELFSAHRLDRLTSGASVHCGCFEARLIQCLCLCPAANLRHCIVWQVGRGGAPCYLHDRRRQGAQVLFGQGVRRVSVQHGRVQTPNAASRRGGRRCAAATQAKPTCSEAHGCGRESSRGAQGSVRVRWRRAYDALPYQVVPGPGGVKVGSFTHPHARFR